MNGSDKKTYPIRTPGRREEDYILRDQNIRYKQLYTLGQTITSEIKMDALFQLIMDQTNQIMGTERSTVFLHDEEADELWSLVATGMKKRKIRIKADSGIAGWVFQNRKQLIINDPYSDHRFNIEVDQRSGFRTENILCIPIINREDRCIGALQTLNSLSGKFTEDDCEFLKSISDYVAIALENSKLYEDIKDYSEKLKATIIRIETLTDIKKQLSKFVPISVAEMVEKDPNTLDSEKVPMEVSILFIDIQNFTRITEDYDQILVNDMVEKHFSKYLECIHRHGGDLNEFSGDGLMVIFRRDAIKTHAHAAVAAGLEIVKENNLLNDKLRYPWGAVDLHIGINSGKAYVGSTKVKSITGERWTYTASGLVTIIAARIGGFSENTKLYVGSETYKLLDRDYDFNLIGNKKFKNIKKTIPIYQVKNKS